MATVAALVCSVPVAIDGLAHGKPDSVWLAIGVAIATFFMVWLYTMASPVHPLARKEWIERGGETNPVLVEDGLKESIQPEIDAYQGVVIDAHWPPDVRIRVIRLLSLLPAAAIGGTACYLLLTKTEAPLGAYWAVVVGMGLVWALSVVVIGHVLWKR